MCTILNHFTLLMRLMKLILNTILSLFVQIVIWYYILSKTVYLQ